MVMVARAGILFRCSLLVCLSLHVAHAAMWNPLDLHLFVDKTGLATTRHVSLVQHRPSKTYEMAVLPDKPWDGGGPMHGAIAGYCSVVQVSPMEIRICKARTHTCMHLACFRQPELCVSPPACFESVLKLSLRVCISGADYDTFGQFGRFLCVAVSKDGGRSWDKPSLGLVEFDGSTDNNIVAGKQLNSSSVQESIEPGTVFIDTNPACPAAEKWKMVITWQGGATMFASADGFNFKNMTASPALTGSDSQDVVFWDPRVGSAGAYVYYGRSHLKGGQNESCADSLGPGKIGSVSGPGRSVNHFVIGGDVTKWPVHSADTDAEKLTILNTDELDPPCIDIYTNVATPLGDAYFFWPMMYNHFDEFYSQGRGNDGLNEARMAVSRDGTNVSYITRDAWLARGSGQPRLNHTGICETPLHRCIAARSRLPFF